MARILIPTRNRPTSLMSVVGFLNQFYPDTKIIVADGSNDTCAEINRENMTRSDHNIEIDYRRYDYDMPFFDRLLDVLRGESDEFMIMGSDDDFPFMDALNRVEAILEKDNDAVLGMGAMIHMFLKADTEMHVRLGVARPIPNKDPLARCRSFSTWPYSTTYAVTRREHLIERYERARDMFLVGFFDFGLGMHDAVRGRIRTVPEFSFIGTRNYNHSYLRAEPGLIFIDRADDVKKVIAQIASDLEDCGALGADAAKEMAIRLIKPRIAELAGAPVHKMSGFEEKPMFLNPVVQAQITQFEDVFHAVPSKVRTDLHDRLAYITAETLRSAKSDDNDGEAHNVATLESQMQDGKKAGGKGNAAAAQDKPAPRNRRVASIPFRMTGIVNPAGLEWYDYDDA